MTTEYQRRAERNHRRDCVDCQQNRERLLRSALDVYVACESLAYDVTTEDEIAPGELVSRKPFLPRGTERPDVERWPLAAPSGAVPEGDSTPPSGHQRDKETS